MDTGGIGGFDDLFGSAHSPWYPVALLGLTSWGEWALWLTPLLWGFLTLSLIALAVEGIMTIVMDKNRWGWGIFAAAGSGYCMGVTVREPEKDLPLQAVNFLCVRCRHRLAWIVIRGHPKAPQPKSQESLCYKVFKKLANRYPARMILRCPIRPAIFT